MAAGKFNILCGQGDDLGLVFAFYTVNNDVDPPVLVPYPLTGGQAAMQVRQNYGFNATLLDLGSQSPLEGLVIDGTAGTITLSLTGAQTGPLPPISAVYDIKFTDSAGGISRLLEGSFIISPEVTE